MLFFMRCTQGVLERPEARLSIGAAFTIYFI
jgi:hypothetical protein